MDSGRERRRHERSLYIHNCHRRVRALLEAGLNDRCSIFDSKRIADNFVHIKYKELPKSTVVKLDGG